jgi:acyl-homoserine lactone acylase PvdQ
LTGIIKQEYNDYFDDYFSFWIEIKGEYYNHAYESPEIKNLMNQYIQKINQYLKTIILSKEENIFEYFFPLSYDYMSKSLGIKNVDAKNLLKVTDCQYDVDYFDEKFNEFLKNYIMRSVDRNYYGKIQELKDFYKNQFKVYN